jgi:hypothetical protein
VAYARVKLSTVLRGVSYIIRPVRSDVRRPHSATWFGVCSYRKLKVVVEKRKRVCPICGEPLVDLQQLGSRCIVKNQFAHDYLSSFVDDACGADGSPNYEEVASVSYRCYGSGSFEE